MVGGGGEDDYSGTLKTGTNLATPGEWRASHFTLSVPRFTPSPASTHDLLILHKWA